ncbi:MAG TPA: antibiotic biosynthesis monooxygenase [Gammaproteobacteria bacterium]|nr:antibiotic biosynthesis monooxygenase [Gammaproteobacteria bacterium]MEC8012533.1 antibiotic biosynthesis monooxygenase [Pseudomonadota bacterium]HBF08121.1 antibiotic biosynthesis monooxygenase [Gammaproteobacteria bacterium]HCK93363.1 antibiotic biosynthesis monooxygenase [Gammaproteobacteria bacterium]|tara:strand:+ start:648 stop:920 length:273 start_codon:yes stop_codon:yes gene_type:complete
MVKLEGYILIPEQELEAVQTALTEHKALTRAEPGCLVFKVTQDETQPNKYHVYEEFQDEASFQSHQNRVKESQWGAVTQNVQRFYEINYI